jgi:fumarylacetoacetase
VGGGLKKRDSTVTSGVDETHDPTLTSWVASANGHKDFPVQSLPFGVFSVDGGPRRIGVAIGDQILDLAALAAEELLPGDAITTLSGSTLNKLFGLDAAARATLRRRLSRLLTDKTNRPIVERMLLPASGCSLHMPAMIGDYTDFYAGIHHATNVGMLFRPDNPLLPNYKYVPIGYHGRASSIRPSGEPVIRPSGQSKPAGAESPSFGPSNRLDYELELGIWIGRGNALGAAIPIAEASEHIAGFCLLNDWSARDLQAWEYQPLGPFLAKSFQTTISPWVITAEAMAPFRRPQQPRPPGDPRPLDYLWDDQDQASGALAIELEATLSTARMRQAGLPPHRLSSGPASNLYWTVAQLLTHHTSNGCNLNPGDLLGTGTISGPDQGSFGSLMEISKGGTEPIRLASGETRIFLEEGDEVSLSATAHADGYVPIGFGPCTGVILPARS